MSNLLTSLEKIINWLEDYEISYMVFGGLANTIYGNPRQTYDIDIKISIDKDNINNFISKIREIGQIVPEEPKEFIDNTKVLPINLEGVRIDLVLASLPFEERAIKRSKVLEYKDITMSVCTIEDFIIQKSVSERDKDWNDIKKIIKLNREEIDWDYLLNHCRRLSNFLSKSKILDRIKQYKNEN